MPKQSGLYRLKGKIGGLSHYKSQVGGDLVRTINSGMSERVKTAPEFANTRLNAAEFGAAGQQAGLFIRPVSIRWRYLLDPIATGKLAKTIKECIAFDTTHSWGERDVPVTFMPNVQDALNGLFKRPVPDEIKQGLATGYSNKTEAKFAPSESAVSVSENLADEMRSQGSDGYICQLYRWNIPTVVYFGRAKKYVANIGIARFELLDSLDDEWSSGATLVDETLYDIHGLPAGGNDAPFNEYQVSAGGISTGKFGGVLVVLLPYRMVNNEKHILQELCSAYYKELPNVG